MDILWVIATEGNTMRKVEVEGFEQVKEMAGICFLPGRVGEAAELDLEAT